MRPPRRVCTFCSSMYWGYGPSCPACAADGGRENAAAGVAIAKEQRAGRRQERVDSLEEKKPGVPYNEFPPGF